MEDKIFERNCLSNSKDIILWWLNGIGFLNLFYLLYVIFHLLILVKVFHNGWIFFLLPIIFFVWLLINSIFISGLLLELFLSRILKLNFNFDKYAPLLKGVFLIISILIVISISVYDILSQIDTV